MVSSLYVENITRQSRGLAGSLWASFLSSLGFRMGNFSGLRVFWKNKAKKKTAASDAIWAAS